MAESADPPAVCLQVNTSGEATKHGWSPEQILDDAEAIGGPVPRRGEPFEADVEVECSVGAWGHGQETKVIRQDRQVLR